MSNKFMVIIVIYIVSFYPYIVFSKPSECLKWKGLTFMKIPSGNFMMGGVNKEYSAYKKKGYSDEYPKNEQKVNSFCIMKDHLSENDATRLNKYLGVNFFNELNWEEANKLANLLTKKIGKKIRLATEVEWEYAARGGLDEKEFPWGNIGDKYKGKSVQDIVIKNGINCSLRVMKKIMVSNNLKNCILKNDDYDRLTGISCIMNYINNKNIKSTPENGYGLINLGREWEWTSSKYMPYPYNSKDGRESPHVKNEEFRVLRGGGSNTEKCLSYTSLRGYGMLRSSYHIRFVLDND